MKKRKSVEEKMITLTSLALLLATVIVISLSSAAYGEPSTGSYKWVRPVMEDEVSYDEWEVRDNVDGIRRIISYRPWDHEFPFKKWSQEKIMFVQRPPAEVWTGAFSKIDFTAPYPKAVLIRFRSDHDDTHRWHKIEIFDGQKKSFDSAWGFVIDGSEVVHLENVGPEPEPVGGTAFPANKIALLAPWIILAALIAIVAASFLVYKRRH